MKTFKCDLEGKETVSIKLDRSNFEQFKLQTRNSKVVSYLIIGFDTEYQSKGIEDSSNKKVEIENEILSYQYSCSIFRQGQDSGIRWNNIILPKNNELSGRLTLKEFVELAISDGINTKKLSDIPRNIYLTAHFTRADLPAFADFKNDSQTRSKFNLSNLRNSPINLKKDVDIKLGEKDEIPVKLKIRDTLHLAPQNAKSLQNLGDVLGFKKIKLGGSDKESKEIKQNMKRLMLDDWDLFREYAIRDADICTHFCEKMITISSDLTGKFHLPLTLTSMGVDLLMKNWEERGMDSLAIVGRQKIKQKFFNQKSQRFVFKSEIKPIQRLHWHYDFAVNCYSGGRNEQFAFGSSEKGNWYDYDLQGCYPSCMSLIGIPNWDGLKFIGDLEELLNYKVTDLAFANVDFEFPDNVRYPCLPVRVDDGSLVFPKSGNCSTHISEIKLAQSMGCKLEFVEGRFIPSIRDGMDDDGNRNRLFEGFLKSCIEKRQKHPKKSMMNLFWKEIANSSYGKLAQGLRKRRIYNLELDEGEDLMESKITNPFLAAFVTAFARGTLSEIMNNLPENREIFSVTTDGFLTNATPQEMEESVGDVLARYYKSARIKLDSNSVEDVYEIKHVAKQLIGFRTRGQATLIKGSEEMLPDSKEDERVVLAKGGIKLTDKYGKSEENSEIVELFFSRTPTTILPFTIGAGIKDVYKDGWDFVNKNLSKRLSMEFDWKRKPYLIGMRDVVSLQNNKFSHLYFKTRCWESVEQYTKIRELWEQYNKNDRHCLKTVSDYNDFANYVENMLSVDSVKQRHLKKVDGDLIRLRRDLITARRYRLAGTHKLVPHCFGYEKVFPDYKLPAWQFAEILNDKLHIPTTKFDVDNGNKIKTFTPNQTPNTNQVRNRLKYAKTHLFPHLKIDEFLAKKGEWNIFCEEEVD